MSEKSRDFDAQARELVAMMTLEERAAMLRYDAPGIPRLNVPSYNWWNEALHGVARAGTATVFPQAIGLAAMFDREMIAKIGRAIATEGRAKYNAQMRRGDRGIYKGLTFWSPNVNIFRDPRWGRGHETYGEDPYLTGELGAAFVEALQERDENGYMKAAACAKHFAVHSGPEDLRHEFNAQVSPKDLWETYLPAFEKLVTRAGVEGVMGAYNRLYGEPCCGSRLLLKEILRERWHFDGYVTSDCWAIRDFHEHHRVTDTVLESVALAIHNGCDLNCGDSYPYIMAAYENGLITEEEITECAEHVMRTRLRLGLFDENCAFNAIGYDKVCCPEHIDLSIEAARRSVVLLKNDGLLPLDAGKIGSIGVIGPNADNRVALMGNYHGTADRYITLLDAMQAEADANGFRVFYSEGCPLRGDHVELLGEANDRFAEAVSVAEASDVVLLCLGLDETIEGEEAALDGDIPCGDKAGLGLPGRQQALMEAVCAVGKPVVLVLMSGSAMDLRYADVHCAAILQAWYPGARGGLALADLLFGRVSPSGKLPVTFYKSTEDLPDFTDYAMENRTYRYYRGEPLYPFGFGLSYADVRLTDASLDARRKCVTATVRNASAIPAEEVVQVYVRDLASPLAPLHPVLCGFQRVALDAGASETISVPLDENAFTVVNEDGERVDGSGHYAIYVGFNQPDPRSAALTGRQCVEILVD